MPYQIIIPKPVKKQLDAIPNKTRQRILEKIKLLADNPRLESAVKLKGYRNEYRIRIGDYRVRYEIKDKELIIILLRCKHRRDVYRK